MRNDLASVVLELKASASGSMAGWDAAWPWSLRKPGSFPLRAASIKSEASDSSKISEQAATHSSQIKMLVGPFTRRRTCPCSFPQKEQRIGLPFSSKLSCMLPAILGVLRGEVARGDDTVDQAVVEGLGSGQVVVALGIGLDLLDGLARGVGQNLVELAAGLLDLLGHDLDLGLLTLSTAAGW